MTAIAVAFDIPDADVQYQRSSIDRGIVFSEQYNYSSEKDFLTTSGVIKFRTLGYSEDSISTTASGTFHFHPQEYMSLLSALPWIRNMYHEKDANDVATLLPYFKEFNSLLASESFSECDTLLKYLQVRNLSNTLLVSAVRLTYSYQDKLPSWKYALNSVRAEMISRQLDDTVLLKGLS